MSTEILAVIIGGSIGMVSVLLGSILQYQLDKRKYARQSDDQREMLERQLKEQRELLEKQHALALEADRIKYEHDELAKQREMLTAGVSAFSMTLRNQELQRVEMQNISADFINSFMSSMETDTVNRQDLQILVDDLIQKLLPQVEKRKELSDEIEEVRE